MTYVNGTYDSPNRTLDSYSLDELLQLTQQYTALSQMPRQALNDEGVVYIAANLTEEEGRAGFMLGDSLVYGGYVNHPLLPGQLYNVSLRGAVPGTDTPLYFTSSTLVSTFLHMCTTPHHNTPLTTLLYIYMYVCIYSRVYVRIILATDHTFNHSHPLVFCPYKTTCCV